MHELDDIALLRQYTGQNSEEAFGALVSRHVNKVYSVALRHTRNPHQAEEITQAVFVIFAQRAKKLRQHAVLSGWLYETSRLTAVTFNGQLPGDISQLTPYFNPPIDGTILQRYQLLQTGNLSDVSNNEPSIAEKAPVDDQYDTLFKISATGFSYQGTGTSWVNGSGKGGFGRNITAKIKPFERQ